MDVNAIVSAARVLTTTFWIFRLPHEIGLITQVQLLAISLWVPKTMLPACDEGTLGDANDASEKARKRKSSVGMGFMVKHTS